MAVSGLPADDWQWFQTGGGIALPLKEHSSFPTSLTSKAIRVSGKKKKKKRSVAPNGHGLLISLTNQYMITKSIIFHRSVCFLVFQTELKDIIKSVGIFHRLNSC